MKFECQESCKGRCCTSAWGGYIYLTKEDTLKLSNHLKQSPEQFSELGQFDRTRFSLEPVVVRYMKMQAGSCVHFKDGKCGVYEARPTQCKTFPFWPENMGNAVRFEKLKEICPGIGMGKDYYPPNKAVHMTNLQIEADKELCNPRK